MSGGPSSIALKRFETLGPAGHVGCRCNEAEYACTHLRCVQPLTKPKMFAAFSRTFRGLCRYWSLVHLYMPHIMPYAPVQIWCEQICSQLACTTQMSGQLCGYVFYNTIA